MKKHMTMRVLSVVLAIAMLVSLCTVMTASAADAEESSAAGTRPVEYLTRGLVGAQVSDGIFLSWRFLADEPDGLSWNVYRDGEKIATINPRDVAPESNYETNPGIVKKNSTPSNYTDPNGTLESVYEVAPVINGVEGEKQGMSVPMLAAVSTGYKGAAYYIPMKPAPAKVQLPHFQYRGYRFGPGASLNANNMKLENGNNWYVVDMPALQAFREPYILGTAVTADDLAGYVAKLNALNNEEWQPTNKLGADGKISDALYAELEAKFIKYVEELDCGTKLPYSLNEDGSVFTSASSSYSTQDMSVGDFDGDGEYEIVVKWRGTQCDPMYSEPIYSGRTGITAPEYIDVYKLDGTLMFRVDTGYNVRSANDHEVNMMVGDFDNDGKSELCLKLGLGARIGNWDEEANDVVYPDTLETVVGGVDGLASTTAKFQEYFKTGNIEALDTYYAILNSFTICYRSPVSGGGNDGPNDPTKKEWIKTYHVGPMGIAKDNQEFMAAFEYDTKAGKGVLVDAALYPFAYTAGSVDGENWAMNPCTQRGNYCYTTQPTQYVGSSSSDYKAQIMNSKEQFWISYPWKAAVWGDAQGNRANRYLSQVASLDGEHIYAISQRGYYHRTTFAAYLIKDGKLSLEGAFDSADSQYWSLGGEAYDYQNRGNHYTATGDVDGDGKDEIVMTAMVLKLVGNKILPVNLMGCTMISVAAQEAAAQALVTEETTEAEYKKLVIPANGTEFATDAVRNNPLNFWAPLRHGDRGGLIPADKTNKIVWFTGSEEHLNDNMRTGEHYGWMPGPHALDPLEGKHIVDGKIVTTESLIYGAYSGSDDEGSVVGNFSNRFPGAQGGASSSTKNVMSLSTGKVVATTSTARGIAQGENAIWFGGGLTHMSCSGANIRVIDDATFKASSYLSTGLTSTGSKSTPTLKADIFGDWREEVIARGKNNTIGIVTSLAPTEYGIRNLMQDPMYRDGVANQNSGYNQVGFASFYLGDEAPLPTQNKNVYVLKADLGLGAETDKDSYETNETITVTATLDFDAAKAYLVNENGTGLASTRWVDENADGTYTWTLTLSLGTVGERTLKVFADGKDTGYEVSFDVTYPAPAGEPELISVKPQRNVVANEAFNVTFVTNTYVDYVRLFNENGTGLMPSACAFTDKGDVRTWTMTMVLGTAGDRSFTAKVAASDRVFVGDIPVNICVG